MFDKVNSILLCNKWSYILGIPLKSTSTKIKKAKLQQKVSTYVGFIWKCIMDAFFLEEIFIRFFVQTGHRKQTQLNENIVKFLCAELSTWRIFSWGIFPWVVFYWEEVFLEDYFLGGIFSRTYKIYYDIKQNDVFNF